MTRLGDAGRMTLRTASGRTASGHTGLAALLLALAALAVAHVLMFWPGIMVWDAIRQYGQSLSGRYDDWHPPAMNWLWRQLIPLGPGPAPMLVLQALLYWCGFALLATAAFRRRRTGLAVAIAACALLPLQIVLVGTVLKDSMMAGLLLTAAGLMAIRSERDRILRAIAITLLIAAATLRFNALPASVPLLLAVLPARWTRTPGRLVLTAIVATIPLVLAMPVANRLLHAHESGVSLSLVIYDLGGITKHSGVDVFPPVAVADPVAVNAHCYSPISWDSYAWWTADPCPIGFQNVGDAIRASQTSPYMLWARALVAHPVAYAEHRLGHINQNSRFLVHDADLPPLSLQSDPNPWGYHVAPNAPRSLTERIAVASLSTPIGWPIWWFAVGIGVLILSPALRRDDPAVPLIWSAMLYALSYLPLSVASEVRYHFWTISAIALAAVMTADALRNSGGVSRRKLALALLPVVLVTALCLWARLG